QASDYRPLDQDEIVRKLGAGGRDRVAVRNALRELEHAGEIVRIRKNRYVLPSEADLVTGKLSMHQAGYAFLVTDKPGEADVFIAAENTATAMHGDRVVVRISSDIPARRQKACAGRSDGQRTERSVIPVRERERNQIGETNQ